MSTYAAVEAKKMVVIGNLYHNHLPRKLTGWGGWALWETDEAILKSR